MEDQLSAPAEKVTRLVYEVKFRDIYRNCFFHILLSVITCGVYYIIYGRAQIRSYLMSQVSVDGDKDNKIAVGSNKIQLFTTSLLVVMLTLFLLLVSFIFFAHISIGNKVSKKFERYESLKIVDSVEANLEFSEIGLFLDQSNKLILVNKRQNTSHTIKRDGDEFTKFPEEFYDKIKFDIQNNIPIAKSDINFILKYVKQVKLRPNLSISDYIFKTSKEFLKFLDKMGGGILFAITWGWMWVHNIKMWQVLLMWGVTFLAVLFSFYILSSLIKLPFRVMNYKEVHFKWKELTINRNGGNAWKYYLLTIANFLSVFTLGMFSPIIDIKCEKYFWQSVCINNKPIITNVRIIPLMIANLKNLLWFIPTLGISRIWYWAALDRHIYNSIHIDDLKIKSTVEGVDLFFLYFFHILGTVFYAGIFIALSFLIPYKFDDFTTRILISILLSMFITMPKIMNANMKFYTDYHFIIGDVNKLAQNGNAI